MPKEKSKPSEEELRKVFRAAADQDPVAVFHQLADLAAQGINPVETGVIPGNPVTKTVKSVERWTKQQIENAEDAKDDWLDGVKNPSRNPIDAAIAAKDKWWDRLEANKEKFAKNLAKSSPSEIIEIAEKVGSGAYATGVRARESKIKRVVGEIQPLVQAVSNTIQGMSDKTDSDREKRLTSARKLMIELGKKRAGIATPAAR